MIRYGKSNAEAGPGGGREVDCDGSESDGFGDATTLAWLGEGDGALMGGGSMANGVGALAGKAGSGSAGISSSAEEVSIVIGFVGTGACRRV